jgi:glycosyltransferase involved in cell wall biosynthesis
MMQPGSDTRVHLCLFGDATSPHVQRWAREMLARNYRVSLITARPAAIDGVEIRSLTPVRRSAEWLLRVGEARRHVATLAPDILHAHYVTSYGYLAARCGHHPLVMTAWGSDLLVTPQANPWMRWLTRWILRQADLITGDSSSLVAAAQEFRPHAPVHELHWGVDLARFHPVHWAHKPGVQLVSLRAWEPNYNIDTIVRAFALMHTRLAPLDLRLHLLGGGSMEHALRSLAVSAGVADRIFFHGRLDDAGMARVLAEAKISISVPTSDATSVAMLESMASGLAVVASQLQSNAHWIDAQWLVPPHDAHALADLLERLAVSEGLAEQVGRQNAARIAKDGDRTLQMDRMHALYQQLANAR